MYSCTYQDQTGKLKTVTTSDLSEAQATQKQFRGSIQWHITGMLNSSDKLIAFLSDCNYSNSLSVN